MSDLHKKFQEAGLRVITPKRQMVGTSSDVFQMDVIRQFVKRDNKRIEVFRIWKGHEGNRVLVLNTDKKLKQLVLLVDEPERNFEEELPALQRQTVIRRARKEKCSFKVALQRSLLSGERAGICTREKMSVVTRTPGNKRHYLCGVDERQLFIAQLPKGVSSVKQAHAELKGGTVQTAEGRAPGCTQRQGEWFFLNVTTSENRRINEALREKLSAVRVVKNRGIGAGVMSSVGKPHVAAEQLALPAVELEHGFTANDRPDIFVRGKITHPDHRPLKFKKWRKVLLNNEARVTGPSRRSGGGGVYWID